MSRVSGIQVEAAAKAMCELEGFAWETQSFQGTPNGNDPEEERNYRRDMARAALEAAMGVAGEIVVTRNEAGAIVAVTRNVRNKDDPYMSQIVEIIADADMEVGEEAVARIKMDGSSYRIVTLSALKKLQDGEYELYATPPSDLRTKVGEVDVDRLAQIIRKVNGNNSMGAGALAEAIISEWMKPSDKR